MHTELLSADAQGIARAAALLAAGDVVAFPTETVYGLGADAARPDAVARIYAAKGRPAINPLIVHVLDLAAAIPLVHVDDRARALCAALWPGPLTLVLRARAGAPIAPAVRAGLPTIAVRAPAHPVARALLATFGRPVAAPSANRSGAISPTRPDHVLDQLQGHIPLVLESGRAEVGIESTILDLTGPTPTLLRHGAVTPDMLEAWVGPVAVSSGAPERPTAPGQMLRHYAPSVPLRVDADHCGAGEAWLGFGPGPAPPQAIRSANLSARGDLSEAAANLYDLLHALDGAGISGIAVAPVPTHGLGAAITDRLRRAAAASRA